MSDLIFPGSDDLDGMPSEDLIQKFRECLAGIATNYLVMARVILMIEKRDEDTTPLRCAIFDVLRKIAYGQLVPELITYIKDGATFRKLCSLPLPDQKRIANGEPLRVIEGVDDAGNFIARLVQFSAMTDFQKKQVFARDGLRTDEQQWQHLKGKRPEVANKGYSVKFTAKQEAALIKRAAREGKSPMALIREALEAFELL